jgi:hypothetical protein
MEQIIQILTASPGWRAVFLNDETELVTENVACWGLVENEDGREVRPLVVCGQGIEDVGAAGNYVGVVGPDTDPESLRPVADAMRKRNGHGDRLDG